MSPRGRRPAGVDTRAQILAAARTEFAAKGYDGASVRGIARSSGVDPALVHHYFSGKARLFAEAVAMVAVRPDELVTSLLAGPVEGLGERIVRTFLGVWDAPANQEQFVALVRSVVAHDEAARVFQEFLSREVLGRVTEHTGVRNGALRASLAASQLVGLGILRYVMRYPPLAAASADEIAGLVGPTLQRYLADPGS